jgi:hypothetical protein
MLYLINASRQHDVIICYFKWCGPRLADGAAVRVTARRLVGIFGEGIGCAALYLIAPMVSPRTNCRETMILNMITGRAIMVPVAMIWPQGKS